jgi:hypothetical protein
MGSVEQPQPPTYGKFHYITKGIKPTESKHLYHLPETSEFGDVRTLPMTDIRHSLDLGENSPYKLNQQGFTARRHHTALKSLPYTHASWNNDTVLKEVYISEIEALLLKSQAGRQYSRPLLCCVTPFIKKSTQLPNQRAERRTMIFRVLWHENRCWCFDSTESAVGLCPKWRPNTHQEVSYPSHRTGL